MGPSVVIFHFLFSSAVKVFGSGRSAVSCGLSVVLGLVEKGI